MLSLGSTLGNIRVVERLGRGSMGEVYTGLDTRLERRVALKVLEHQGERSAIEKVRLLREARILSRLRHPKICQIYDLVEGEALDVLVLELIEGETLQATLAAADSALQVDGSVGELSPRRRLTIAADIAEALAAAHAEGVIHRDLKPANVMLTAEGGVKVLDFGLARLADLERELPELRQELAYRRPLVPSEVDTTASSISDHDLLAGTPRYMSPEQARGEPVTTASDMYTYGIVIQELLTGQPAYPTGLPFRLLRERVATGRPLGADAIAPPALRHLVEQLVSLAPATRPTARETVEILGEITALPRQRRRRTLAGVAMAGLGALAVAMTVQAVRIGRLADDLERQVDLARSRHLTAEATSRMDEEVDVALLLSLEALERADTLQARSALVAALHASPALDRVLRDPMRRLHRLAWSPNGTSLATATSNGTVIWDTVDGRPVNTLGGHTGPVWNVAWSPDGRALATAGRDRTVRLWDPFGGRPLGKPLTHHDAPVWGLAWSPDGTFLATSSDDMTIRLWDAQGGEARGSPLIGHTQALSHLAWSPDGLRIASTSYDGTLRLWDPTDQTPVGPPHDLRAGWGADVAWSPDGALLAISAEDVVRFFDPVAERFVEPSLEGHMGRVWGVAWSPDGRQIATAGTDKTVRLWDPHRRAQLGPPLTGHHHEVWALAFRPDGGLLSSASLDGTILLWDPRPQRLHPLRGHSSWVYSVAFRPNGFELLSVGNDGFIRRWDPATGEPLGEPLQDTTSALAALTWSPDGHRFAVAGEDRKIYIWDADRLVLSRPALAGHPDDGIWALAWSPDGGLLASAGQDRTLRLWDPDTGELAAPPMTGHDATVRSAAWSPDGELLASASYDGTIRLWQRGGEPALAGALEAHAGGVHDVAWSPDGNVLASVGRDRAVRRWHVLRRLDSAARLVGPDAEPGWVVEPASPALLGHGATVAAVAWSPDGHRLATASSDADIFIWEVSTGQPVIILNAHESGIMRLVWSPDSRTLVSGGTDGTVRLYDLSDEITTWRERACRRAGRNLSHEEHRLFLNAELPYRAVCPRLPVPSGTPEPVSEQGTFGSSGETG